MNLTEITNNANAFTDENFTTTFIQAYVNEAIGKINTNLKCSLPFFSNASEDYLALSESWIRMLFIPYASYGIKQNDGSINEANRFLNTFQENFVTLESNKYDAIGLDYRNEDFGGVFYLDTTQGINVGWFGDGQDETYDD